MKKRTKNIILATVGVLGILAIVVWYTLPVLGYELFFKGKVPLIRPRQIAALPEAPAKWVEVNFDGLKIKLPLYKLKSVSGIEEYASLTFSFESCRIFLNDLAVPKVLATIYEEKGIGYPATLYQKWVDVVRSSPSDVSFFNARARNWEASSNQLMKGMMGEGLYEIGLVKPQRLKAIYWKSASNKLYQASAKIYNQNESNYFSIIVSRCGSKQELDETLLRTLGGISMPEKRLDLGIVQKDIRKIIDSYSDNNKKTGNIPIKSIHR